MEADRRASTEAARGDQAVAPRVHTHRNRLVGACRENHELAVGVRAGGFFFLTETIVARRGARQGSMNEIASSPLQRSIEGFHQDEPGDWVAELTCGHGQHVRHKPPFWSRPWVLTAEGRAEKLGAALDCVLCDRCELPAGHAPYKRTPDFDQSSIPAGLRKDHATKRGVWGVLHVLSGRLNYVVEPPLAGEHQLDPQRMGIIVPEVLHRVHADEDVVFFVEFYRKPSQSP